MDVTGMYSKDVTSAEEIGYYTQDIYPYRYARII